MASGIAFALALFLTAVFNINPWADHTYQLAPPIVAGMPAPHRDGREEMVCSSCHIVTPAKAAANAPVGSVLPIVAVTPSPHKDSRSNMDFAACHTIIPKGAAAAMPPAAPPVLTAPAPAAPPAGPVTVTVALPQTTLPPLPLGLPFAPSGEEELNIPPYRFQGQILKVAGTGASSQWGDVYILLDDRVNDPVWINLAPRWYLQAKGCLVRSGLFIKGMAFRDPAPDGPSPSYAMSLTVNGEFCRMRDVHMRGLWLTENGGAGEAE